MPAGGRARCLGTVKDTIVIELQTIGKDGNGEIFPVPGRWCAR